MAAPTRLTDPDRTSPEANTPRMLVSCGSGRPDRLLDGRAPEGMSEPVKTKFLPSRAIPLSRFRADEAKDMADRLLRLFAVHIVAPAHALQLLLAAAIEGNDLRSGQHLDIVDRLDAVDEILRHALRQTRTTH
jgi:hypothetical protein